MRQCEKRTEICDCCGKNKIKIEKDCERDDGPESRVIRCFALNCIGGEIKIILDKKFYVCDKCLCGEYRKKILKKIKFSKISDLRKSIKSNLKEKKFLEEDLREINDLIKKTRGEIRKLKNGK